MESVQPADTPKRRVPRLRQHKRGHFFWRQGGKDVYASRDLREAQRLHALAFPHGVPDRPPRGGECPPEDSKVQGEGRGVPTVREAAERLLALIDPQVTPERAAVYRYELKGFLDRLGHRPVDSLNPDDLLSYRSLLAKRYAPWTANGRLAIARRVLSMAFDLGMVDRPPRLKLLKGLPLGETKAKGWEPKEVKRRIESVEQNNPNLGLYLRVQYLCALRPFSVPELVHGRGWWEGEGVFVLERSKVEHKTGSKQRVCVPPSALELLKQIRPKYASGGRYYSKAVQRAGGFAPHTLRHSAATALATILDVPDEYIECALGHTPSRTKRTYRPQKYQETRRHLERLVPLIS